MKYLLKKIKNVPFWVSVISVFIFLSAESAFAVSEYTPLVGIPGITGTKPQSLGEYINAIYLFTISIGGLIGVLRISLAGVKYSMSDIVTSKEEAKEDIKGVLLGLGILLIPFIVLNTIYSGLTKIDVLSLPDSEKIRLEQVRGGGGGGGSTTTSQGFVQSLPKPPFDTNGVCDPGPFTPDSSETGSGGSCSTDCRAACSSAGGVATVLGGQGGNQCPKIRCSK